MSPGCGAGTEVVEAVVSIRASVEARGIDPELCLPSGVSPAELAAVEAALGFELPAELAAFYQVADGTMVVTGEGAASTWEPVSYDVVDPWIFGGFVRLASLVDFCETISDLWMEVAPDPFWESEPSIGRARFLPFIPVLASQSTLFYGLRLSTGTMDGFDMATGFHPEPGFRSLGTALVGLAAVHRSEELVISAGGWRMFGPAGDGLDTPAAWDG